MCSPFLPAFDLNVVDEEAPDYCSPGLFVWTFHISTGTFAGMDNAGF
jgi:hypothetical protein